MALSAIFIFNPFPLKQKVLFHLQSHFTCSSSPLFHHQKKNPSLPFFPHMLKANECKATFPSALNLMNYFPTQQVTHTHSKNACKMLSAQSDDDFYPCKAKFFSLKFKESFRAYSLRKCA